MSRRLAFTALLLGGAGAFGVAQLTWWEGAAGQLPLTGAAVTAGLASSLPVAALAATALMLLLSARGRRVIGVLVAVLAVGVVAVGVLNPVVDEEAWQNLTANVWTGARHDPIATGWHWGYAAAGLLLLLGASIVVLRAATWSARRPARFDRTPTTTADPTDSREFWKALDAGQDPTDPSRRADSPEGEDFGHNGTDPTDGRSNP